MRRNGQIVFDWRWRLRRGPGPCPPTTFLEIAERRRRAGLSVFAGRKTRATLYATSSLAARQVGGTRGRSDRKRPSLCRSIATAHGGAPPRRLPV